MKVLIGLGLVATLSACAMPETIVKAGMEKAHLVVKGAPGDAVLLIDGLAMGLAVRYDGNPATLILEEGLHQLDIQRAGKPIYSEKTFVGSGETRFIQLNAGEASQ
jgi:hypothetical protein